MVHPLMFLQVLFFCRKQTYIKQGARIDKATIRTQVEPFNYFPILNPVNQTKPKSPQENRLAEYNISAHVRIAHQFSSSQRERIDQPISFP